MISIDRLLGLLAHTIGKMDDAASHFEDALAFCRRAGYRPELAWASVPLDEVPQLTLGLSVALAFVISIVTSAPQLKATAPAQRLLGGAAQEIVFR